jgi:hypothetical protein
VARAGDKGTLWGRVLWEEEAGGRRTQCGGFGFAWGVCRMKGGRAEVEMR